MVKIKKDGKTVGDKVIAPNQDVKVKRTGDKFRQRPVDFENYQSEGNPPKEQKVKVKR